MNTPSLEWVPVEPASIPQPFPGSGLAAAEAGGRKICLARYKENWYAFAWKCPHASGLLSEGKLDQAGQVICPVHHYRFNIRNGYNSTGEGYRLKTYPVEERSDGLYVGFPRDPLSGG